MESKNNSSPQQEQMIPNTSSHGGVSQEKDIADKQLSGVQIQHEEVQHTLGKSSDLSHLEQSSLQDTSSPSQLHKHTLSQPPTKANEEDSLPEESEEEEEVTAKPNLSQPRQAPVPQVVEEEYVTLTKKGFSFNPQPQVQKIAAQNVWDDTDDLATQKTLISNASSHNELKSASDVSELIFYKGKRMIHSQIVKDYEKECKGNMDLVIKRATGKQTIVLTKETKIQSLKTPADLYSFLKKNSKLYETVTEVKSLAQGGEAIVFRVNHIGVDEIVAKCPLFGENPTDAELSTIYNSIFYESQTLRLRPHPNYVAGIKEEIIVYNPDLQVMTGYCVIVECAQYTFSNILTIWNSLALSQEKLEFFSEEKMAFYFIQTLCSIGYLHENNIYYGDMKGPNMLTFRTQEIKLGDLGISIKLDPEDTTGNIAKYLPKGLTKGFVTEDFEFAYSNNMPITKNKLFDNDKYALIQTFQRAADKVNHLLEKNRTSEPIYLLMIQDLRVMSIQETILKWTSHFKTDFSFLQRLAAQMKTECKMSSLRHIYSLSKYKSFVDAIMVHSTKQENSVFHPIEEDQTFDFKEDFKLLQSDKLLTNFKVACRDDRVSTVIDEEDFNLMCIDLLAGFNPEQEQALIEKFHINVVQCLEFGYRGVQFDLASMISYLQLPDESNKKQVFLLLMKENQQKIQYLVNYYDAYINNPRQQELERSRDMLLKLYEISKHLDSKELKARLLLRLANVFYNQYENCKLYAERCIEISQEINHRGYEGQARALLSLITLEQEKKEQNQTQNAFNLLVSTQLLKKAEDDIQEFYGVNSLEYAKLVEVTSKLNQSKNKNELALQQQLESLQKYQLYLGDSFKQTLQSYQRASKLCFQAGDLQSTEIYSLKNARNQLEKLSLKCEEARIFNLVDNKQSLQKMLQYEEFGSVIFKSFLIDYLDLNEHIKGYHHRRSYVVHLYFVNILSHIATDNFLKDKPFLRKAMIHYFTKHGTVNEDGTTQALSLSLKDIEEVPNDYYVQGAHYTKHKDDIKYPYEQDSIMFDDLEIINTEIYKDGQTDYDIAKVPNLSQLLVVIDKKSQTIRALQSSYITNDERQITLKLRGSYPIDYAEIIISFSKDEVVCRVESNPTSNCCLITLRTSKRDIYILKDNTQESATFGQIIMKESPLLDCPIISKRVTALVGCINSNSVNLFSYVEPYLQSGGVSSEAPQQCQTFSINVSEDKIQQDTLVEYSMVSVYSRNMILKKEEYLKNNEKHGVQFTYHPNGQLEKVSPYINGKQNGKSLTYNENGSISMESDSVDGNMHGKFITYHKNGKIDSYQEYVEGKLHGKKLRYQDNGQIRSDESYVEGKIHGKELCYLPNGLVSSEKSYLQGKQHGKYLVFHDNGKICYDEDYVNGKEHGKRLKYYENGQKQEDTDYVNGNQHGKSLKYYENGQIEEDVEYLDDEKHGKYLKYYENGTIKNDIDCAEGRQHGKTLNYYKNGQLAQHYDFVNGVKHGNRYEYTEDGQLIVSMQYDSGKELLRLLYYDNGVQKQILEPTSTEGKKRGKDFYENGTLKYEGELVDRYEATKRDGFGTAYYQEGNIQFQGNFKNDKYEGSGIEYYKDGSKFEGTWADGQKHGDGVFTSTTGEASKQEWINGEMKE